MIAALVWFGCGALAALIGGYYIIDDLARNSDDVGDYITYGFLMFLLFLLGPLNLVYLAFGLVGWATKKLHERIKNGRES
jgi:hypothetical protein